PPQRSTRARVTLTWAPPPASSPSRRLSGSMRPATTMSEPSTSAMLALYCAAVSRRMAMAPPITAGDVVEVGGGSSVAVAVAADVALGGGGISVGDAVAVAVGASVGKSV